ncbi:protein REVEILLE 5 [Gossypium australe]|uniref:Protein REVEILLE 5 n=1 Tax=Gossypium australe TaxID=47621 RepID=A0A5B6UY90_9ROSI|nr:protein REVEILLE 5 [Gossypium australe]
MPPPHPPPSSSVSTSTAGNNGSYSEDPNKKIRKPDNITKSKESWTEQEHDKSLEALQLSFDAITCDPSKIRKMVWFLSAMNLAIYVVFATVVSQVAGPFQSSSALLNSGYMYRQDSSSMLRNPIATSALSSWNYDSVPHVSSGNIITYESCMFSDDAALAGPCIVHNSCYSSSNKITSGTWLFSETIDGGGHGKKSRAMPDFAEVYSFIGSVFDPSASGHLQKLKQLDPINFEMALLLMRNLCVNLTSPEFEDHVSYCSSSSALLPSTQYILF